MKNWDYPTAFWRYGPEEQEAMQRVHASGQYTMAREVEAFEHEFAAWHGVKHGIMVNSGSSANLIAVATLFHKKENPLKRGDRAAVPAIAWSTTYAPLVQYGLEIELMDCDASWNAVSCPFMDDRIKLIVGCSILGNPADLENLAHSARLSDSYFIEDNCESIGAEIGGRKTGTFGLMNTFSFFITHQLSAIEGGMVLTNDDECATLCRQLRAHGWTRDTKKPDKFEDEYDFQLMGYNVRPLELHAAIAREQLKKLPEMIRERLWNYGYFLQLVEGLPIIHPQLNGEPNMFGIHFQCHTTEARARAVKALRANGIDCRLPTGGSFTKHGYGERWKNQPTPNADLIHETGLFIGNAPWAIQDKIEKAVKVLRGVL